MALYERNGYYYIDFTDPKTRRRVRKSLGSSKLISKEKAKEYHDKLKASLWDRKHLNKEPAKLWQEATIKWISENKHKKSLKDDIRVLRWVYPFLKDKKLIEIDRDLIETVAKAKEETDVAPATVNRMLEVIRAILRKAQSDWGWIQSVPNIRMRVENNARIRWLTIEQANRLLANLPFHLRSMAQFTLATGLRAANVKGLKWSQIDFAKRHAYVDASESKTNKAIPVPLNEDALAVLNEQPRICDFVFTYKGKSIKQCNTRAWGKALRRCGIKDFRWHDLRHTWASWHVQNGTSLQELQTLGGWNSFEMVLRYAHLSSDHLQNAANRITVTKMAQSNLRLISNAS